MIVLKFGGTSVGSEQAINNVKKIVLNSVKNRQVIVVFSAMGGVTEQLILLADLALKNDQNYQTIFNSLKERHLNIINAFFPIEIRAQFTSEVIVILNELEILIASIKYIQEVSPKTLDRIMSFGEILSNRILFQLFKIDIPQTAYLPSEQLIKTDNNYNLALVNYDLTNKNIREFIANKPAQLYVAPGFIASTDDKSITTLGRGGSDYTAAIYANAIDAEVLEIWSDVSGMMTADPRIVKNVKKIETIPYHEALELSYFGAKVIYPPTILPVMRKKIPVYLKNSFDPDDKGTLIQTETIDNPNIIRGISSYKEVVVINLEGIGMIGTPGISSRFFGILGKNKINIILITQSSSEQSICVVISKRDAVKAKNLLNQEFETEFHLNILNRVIIENEMAIISVVGDKMRNHSGVSGRMFSALGRNGVNIRAIAQGSSQMSISAVILTADINKALNVLHEEFFENSPKSINLFIVGKGNVAKKLFHLLELQQEYLIKNLNLKINFMGLCDSEKWLIDTETIRYEAWEEDFKKAELGNINSFIEKMISLNLPNCVLADITANESVANLYPNVLQKSIAIVACNKIACSSTMSFYKRLKELSFEFNTSFYFETNVGAGLPIISTLNDLLRSGDKIIKIKAVLSGTLNFVFNLYDTNKSFASVVKQAQDEGYTEPDPRLDLSGLDVMRKILILAREAGYNLEMTDIKNQPFLPDSCMKGDVQNFYKELELNENYFVDLFQKSKIEGAKLKYVASFEPEQSEVKLESILPESPFYHLYGKDNIVLFYTQRYNENPLVIKGAGAGAEVTASGVFGDIIKTFN